MSVTESEHAALRRERNQRDQTAKDAAATAVRRGEEVERLKADLAAKAHAYEMLYADFDTMTRTRDKLREEIERLKAAALAAARGEEIERLKSIVYKFRDAVMLTVPQVWGCVKDPADYDPVHCGHCLGKHLCQLVKETE